ncbi:hypothetical protein BDR26DRAFT_835305 [Obelidium mucronatum]|nr:hypothetical protein BDR26DRAFT_835305 [Obelidium mucronatum]
MTSTNNRWWFGGVASAAAGVATHPLDSVKVRMQTAGRPDVSLLALLADIAASEPGGLAALFRGVDASALRQLTYSSARFAVCEYRRLLLVFSPLLGSILAASIGGVAGGIVGSPADLVNVRMQIDGKLPPEERRNYRNAIDGIIQIIKTEGAAALFNGVGANILRAVLMTAGQIATYDTVKQEMIASEMFGDGFIVHFTASVIGALVATTVCSPVDVIKSKMMAQSQKNPEYSGMVDAGRKIMHREGVGAFFKGWTPAFARLGPQTVLTFVCLEYIKTFYGEYGGMVDSAFDSAFGSIPKLIGLCLYTIFLLKLVFP